MERDHANPPKTTVDSTMAVSEINWIVFQQIPCPLTANFVFLVSSFDTMCSLHDAVIFAVDGDHSVVVELNVVDLIGCVASTVRVDSRYRATFGFPIGIVNGVDVVSVAPNPQNFHSITVPLSLPIW